MYLGFVRPARPCTYAFWAFSTLQIYQCTCAAHRLDSDLQGSGLQTNGFDGQWKSRSQPAISNIYDKWCTIHYSIFQYSTSWSLMCQCAWGIVRQYTILTLLVLQSTVILLRWVPNSHSESLWHVDVYDWAEEAPLGNVCWRITNKDLLQRHLQFTDHLCLIHLFPPSIFNFVFDFFRLTSFQVLLLDIFGGFIMAVASEARSIEDRSWQIELTLWVDASLPSSMSQGCRYSFWLVRLQGFACFASIRKCLASELFWSLTCRNHHWMTGWDSFARSPPSVMTTKHWQLSERFPPFRPLVPFLVLLRHGLIWLDPRLRALRAPLVWLEVISVKLRIQGGLPLCLCL